mgnify:CR=1 FL=1
MGMQRDGHRARTTGLRDLGAGPRVPQAVRQRLDVEGKRREADTALLRLRLEA